MLKKTLVLVAVLAALVTTNAQAQDAKSVLASASQAMGVETLKTVTYSATGFDYALGQSPEPGGPWPKFINKTYTRSIDFAVPSSQVNRVRLQGENPPRGGGNQPIRGEQPNAQTIIVAANTPWAQQLEIYMMPQGFLRAAAARNATLEPSKMVEGKRYQVVSFMGDNKAKVTGYISAQNQVERVETMIDHPVLGDTPFEALYSDFKTVDGVSFPMRIVQNQGGYPIFDLTLSEVKINPAVTIAAAPQGGGGGGGGGATAPATPHEVVSPGVYLFNSGYAVMAIDMGDHIFFLEPGNSEARALAVIAEAKKLMPGKPIRTVLNTHPHFDHSSGLRAFMAEGATILTHEGNRAYLEQILNRPHTLNPDAQQKAGKPLKIEAMSEKKVITGNGHTIELYHMSQFLHHPGMVMAYFPAEKILYQADGFNPQGPTATPPSPPSEYNLALLENIERLKLDVARIIPVHYPADGRTITMDELRRVTGKTNADN